MPEQFVVHQGETHVHQEDLELYVMGRLAPYQISPIHSHLSECAACAESLADAIAFVEELSRFSGKQNPADRV